MYFKNHSYKNLWWSDILSKLFRQTRIVFTCTNINYFWMVSLSTLVNPPCYSTLSTPDFLPHNFFLLPLSRCFHPKSCRLHNPSAVSYTYSGLFSLHHFSTKQYLFSITRPLSHEALTHAPMIYQNLHIEQKSSTPLRQHKKMENKSLDCIKKP